MTLPLTENAFQVPAFQYDVLAFQIGSSPIPSPWLSLPVDGEVDEAALSGSQTQAGQLDGQQNTAFVTPAIGQVVRVPGQVDDSALSGG